MIFGMKIDLCITNKGSPYKSTKTFFFEQNTKWIKILLLYDILYNTLLANTIFFVNIRLSIRFDKFHFYECCNCCLNNKHLCYFTLCPFVCLVIAFNLSRGGGSVKNSLKPTKDIYKESLKSTTKTDQKLRDLFTLDKSYLFSMFNVSLATCHGWYHSFLQSELIAHEAIF